MQSRRTLIGLVALATVLAVGAGAVLAADGPSSERPDGRAISVAGTGEIDAEPDAAVVRVSVTASGDDAGSVSQELANGAQELRATFDEFGLAEDDVQTEGYNVYEDRRSREEPNRTTYRGEHTFSVTLQDVDQVGALVDAAVDGGADDVGGVHYTLSDQRREEIRDEALNAAIDQARTEAATIANASGLAVGQVRSASTQSDDVHPYRAELTEASMDSGDAGTELEPRDVTVTATVDVTFDASAA